MQLKKVNDLETEAEVLKRRCSEFEKTIESIKRDNEAESLNASEQLEVMKEKVL